MPAWIWLVAALGLAGAEALTGDMFLLMLSGGALAANPMFSTGLERIGEAARHIFAGEASRVLAHATSGPALQQNLVAVLEGK